MLTPGAVVIRRYLTRPIAAVVLSVTPDHDGRFCLPGAGTALVLMADETYEYSRGFADRNLEVRWSFTAGQP